MKKIILFGFIYLSLVISILVWLPVKILSVFVTYFLGFLILFLPFILFLKFNNQGMLLKKRLRGALFAVLNAQKEAKNLLIDSNVRIHKPQYLEIGANVSIDNGAEFFPLGKMGESSYSSKIIIGNNVHIGSYNRFASMSSVTIEDDVLFAAFVHITDHSHEFRNIKMPVHKQGVFTKGPVCIGKGAWLGFRCNILSGVTVGEHAIIAAGSIVTKDVPPYSVVAGCPAKLIKQYDFHKKEWVNV